MRKILVVIGREYNAAVRTRTFLISLLMMPLLMGGSFLVQLLLQDKDRRYAVVDRTPGGAASVALRAAVELYNTTSILDPETGEESRARILLEFLEPEEDVDEQRVTASNQVRDGKFAGFLDIGLDALSAPTPTPQLPGEKAPEREERFLVRLHTSTGTVSEFGRVVLVALTAAAQEKRIADLRKTLSPADQAKITSATVLELVRPVEVQSRGLALRDPTTGKIEDNSGKSRAAPLIVPFAFLMLMFMVIMMSSTPLMQGVVEEKGQKIAEVLLGSLTPFQLMLGKLIGMTAVSLTVSSVYLAGAYWAANHYGFDRFLPVSLMVWFLAYQALAALMYGSLFIAIGAACSDIKETQNLLWPVMVLAMAPLFVLTKVIQEPNGVVATSMSFFPFSTPMLMIARQSIPPGVPSWQPMVGMGIVLLTSLLCVYVAGRIFRVGILMQGKGANLGEMMRWAMRS